MGIFVSGRYLAITCEVEVEVIYVFIYPCKMFLYGDTACWLCELHLEFGSHISSVRYVNYVCSAPFCILDYTEFICCIYMYIHPLYVHVR